jgi:hypothetical protein
MVESLKISSTLMYECNQDDTGYGSLHPLLSHIQTTATIALCSVDDVLMCGGGGRQRQCEPFRLSERWRRGAALLVFREHKPQVVNTCKPAS